MKKILERTTTKLFVDLDEKVVLGQMNGDILFEDYKDMLLGGAKLASNGKINNIIIDRRNILKQDAECRLWVKNYYLKEHLKPLVPKIQKVAIVESKSIVGKIYGKTIFASLNLIYPNLKMKSFSELDKALEWIKTEKPKPVHIDEVINDEKNFFNDVVTLENKIIEEENKKELVTAGHGKKGEAEAFSKDSSLINKLLKYFFPN